LDMFDNPLFRVSCLANLSAGYNLAITGQVLFIIQKSIRGDLDEESTSIVGASAFAGAVLGQLTMGYVGERFGIVRGLVITFFIMCIGAMFGSFGCWGRHVLELIACSRFIVGFGAGGVYPLAAIASAQEQHGSHFQGRRVMLSFSFQGIGQLLAPLWVLMLDFMLGKVPGLSWRIALFSGGIPAAFGLAASTEVTNSNTHSSEKDNEPSFGSRWTRKNLFKMIGTGGSWFLFDVIFYGNIVFNPYVVDLLFSNSSEEKIAVLSAVLSLCSLPGLYLASYYSDRLGRKRIQLFGFGMLVVLFLVLFVVLGRQHSPVTVFMLYCATFFFFNFGPNATTFCLPAETFDEEVRPFFNGLSAASGKLGALVGAALFKFVLDSTGLKEVMLLSCIICMVALVVTQVFVVDRVFTHLEQIPEEEYNHPGEGLDAEYPEIELVRG